MTDRKEAAERARKLLARKADSMPVAEPMKGPQQVRVVEGDLVDPAPSGGVAGVFKNFYVLRLIVSRQLAQQYGGSLLGMAWSYIQPGARFVIYYFVVATVLRAHDMQNFALHLFCGLVFIGYFGETWGSGTRSIWANRIMLMKMRMPREIFPVASIFTGLYHAGPQILILTGACLLIGWDLDWAGVGAGLLGFAILLTFAMGMALLFAALNVYFRDFQNVVATLNQFNHFLVPMLYGYSMIARMGEDHPVIYQLYMANPLVEGTLLLQRMFWLPTVDNKAEVLATEFPPDLWLRGWITLGVCLAFLGFAQWAFSKLERRFSERL